VPNDWPEQEVTIVEEDFSPGARVSYRMVEGTVKQMVVQIPFLPPGQEVRALVTAEVRRKAQLRPQNTDDFVLPNKRRAERSVRLFLGPSPGIESTSSKIRNVAKELSKGEQSAWRRVESMYDWVREKVEYRDGKHKGAIAALGDGTGCNEDLVSLFIALCRASDIPARTVWVHGGCYPEFYLQDGEGEGHWIPCRMTGTRAFGEMPDHSPILEKGDNFRSPKNPRERKRYLPESLDGAGGRPRVKFVRELLAG
jgi:transglutaminase-like putative cysteine protease